MIWKLISIMYDASILAGVVVVTRAVWNITKAIIGIINKHRNK